MTQPKKWTEVYPYGTKEGDEEAKFFRALARNQKFEFRSTGALVKTTGLSRERVEEIIDKYMNKISPPLIYPHSTNDDHWCYWERCPDILKKDKRGISDKDKDNRIDNHMSGICDAIMTDSHIVSDDLTDALVVETVISDIKESLRKYVTTCEATSPRAFTVDASSTESCFTVTETNPNCFIAKGWYILS